MTLQDFIQKYNGHGVNFDGAYGNQCVDLMNQYLHDVFGIQNPISIFPGGTAYQIYENANNANFQKVANTPTGVPTAGDIIFWNTTIGSAGHVAIFVLGDTNNFTSFDLNWPAQQDANGNGIGVAHEQSHNYNGVAGWLHPTVAPVTTGSVTVDSATYTKLVHNSTVSDSVNTYLVLPANSDWSAIQQKLDQQKQNLQNAQNQITELNANWNAIAADLGLPAGTTKDALDAAVKTLQANEQKDSQTVTSQNQQIGTLNAEITTLKAQIDSLQKQLQASQVATNEPTTNISYQQLYTQAEAKVNQLQTQLQAANQALAQAKSQYANTSTILVPKKQLLQTFFSRLFSGN